MGLRTTTNHENNLAHKKSVTACVLCELEDANSKLASVATDALGAFGRAMLEAIAHNLLVIAYYILRGGTCYQDLGPDYSDRLNPESLGFKVTSESSAQVA